MSFIDLTPVASCSSSTANSDSNFSTKTQQNIHAFNQLLNELDFGAEETKEREFLEIEDVPDTYDEDDVEVEEEDVAIKYPYEREDVYDGLKERIEQRLQDAGDEQLEKEAKEIALIMKVKQAEWAEEDKQERLEALQKKRVSESVYICVMCSKAFPDPQQLQKHTETFHDLSGQRFKCTLCGKGYKHKKNLATHQLLHNKEIPCSKCSLVFQSQATLHVHELKIHGEKDLVEKMEDDEDYGRKKCPKCGIHYSEKIFKRHTYYCLNKEKIAEKRRNLKAQSTPTSPAMSTISCASFSSYQPGPSTFRSPLSSPVVSFRDKSCSVCGEAFASRQSMLRHVGRKHPEVKDDPSVTAVRYVTNTIESPTHQYACVDCGKRLTTRAALTTHRTRAHSGKQGTECPHCQKTFIVPSELRKHINRVHGGGEDQKTSKGEQLENLPDIDAIF
ncbi:Protein CBG20120 [Caenorhabditis briggsae]|uniref:C2H2-type domain-containing protein n=3 Tax=Caenorhabditis briggsae TaxID=6238 RepID=A0AAE9D9I2_CAEBR|nr:Protein CBG20120 [Caenorhabditis briggsae]ULT99066.1 hypothetical protein L3Y34_000426 [Caenorhabditis briggsae]CAP37217.1 Protein CBG20120 [Caenorhabditis briggsae]